MNKYVYMNGQFTRNDVEGAEENIVGVILTPEEVVALLNEQHEKLTPITRFLKFSERVKEAISDF